MPKTLLPVGQILTLLEELPGHIASATEGMTPEQLHRSPRAGEWSAIEVLAHVRSCADVWGEAIATMLTVDRPTIKAVNPRTWIAQTDYPALPFAASFAAYQAQRVSLLALLKPLPPRSWQRSATITGAGAQLTWTVQFYADRLARHERSHVKQFA